MGQPPARHELARLQELGANADGEAGEPHPVRAIREVLAKHPADEIILANRAASRDPVTGDRPAASATHTFAVPVTVLGSTRADSKTGVLDGAFKRVLLALPLAWEAPSVRFVRTDRTARRAHAPTVVVRG